MNLPTCHCGTRYQPEPGAPEACPRCTDEDQQAPVTRQPWDVPLFPVGTNPHGPDLHHMEDQ